MFITKWAATNKIIQIQGIKCAFKLSTILFIGFIGLIMLFSCIFPTFYENCHKFWRRNYFRMKFGIFMSNYLLYNARKSERKIFIFSRVIEILLGDYFFFAHSAFAFKKGFGCAHAIYSVNRIVNHFNSLNLTVNLCSVDISKAFDKVNHHKLL